VAWLLEHPRGILADDMGLGKTLQVLEAVRTLLYRGMVQTALVVCPRTLVSNWQDESARWAPELLFASSTSWIGDPEGLWRLGQDRRVHLTVVHYDRLKALPAALIGRRKVQLLILDEAHRVRRSEASVTAAVRSLDASSVWALSGTPVERDTQDLATLLSIISPEKYSVSIAALGDEAVRSFAEPMLLRRKKVDVLTDLPVVMEEVHHLDLTAEQRTTYAETLADARAYGKTKGELLTLVGDLLSICDLDPPTGSSSKIDDIVERLQRVCDATEKAIVFSYKLKPLDLLESRLKEASLGFVRIDGRTGAEERATVIARFRNDPSVVALLASSRVASEGLTLTEANHAFFINRWWNPSNSDQARDRIVRIGQDRPVVIHSYVCRDTIEERLEQILESKRDLVERVVDSLSKGATPSIGAADLAELFKPSI
jgi:SNF2 family DNA or RNA helicase